MTINRKKWRLVSRFGEEKKVIHNIKQIVTSSSPFYDRLEDIITVVAEACLNAFEHGNKMKDDLPVCVCMIERVDRLCFRICDEGNGFNHINFMARQRAMDDRGWGLFLMTSLADCIETGFEDNRFFIEIQFLKTCKEEISHARK